MEGIDREPAQRFNRMIVDFAHTGRNYGVALPLDAIKHAGERSGAPRSGRGLDGKAQDAEMAAKHAMSILIISCRRKR